MAVRRSGAIERCLQLAEELTRTAVGALDAFPPGLDQQALEELATSLATRRA